MMGEATSDLTIPRPGSTSARGLLSATLRPLLTELGGLAAQVSEPALREQGRAFAAACGGCPARAGCCGVPADYLERFGGEELCAANLRAGAAVVGPRWMFVGTGSIEQVEMDRARETGAKRQVRLPVVTGDDG